MIDPTNFSDLAHLSPDDVTARTGSLFDSESGQYRLTVWGKEYVVDLGTCEVKEKASGRLINTAYISLFIIFYLIKALDLPASGTWVSEKDLKGGAGFFRGPHLIPTGLIVDRFKEDISAFSKRCTDLGGQPVEFADAAFCFEITPTIPVAVLFWKGNEDFPSEAKLLFDKTIEQHLPLDIIWALAVAVCRRLSRMPGQI